MRSTRIAKYGKKYKKIMIAVQILFILYAALVSVSLLTSNTSAFFNNTRAVSVSIPTGSWWDGSDLTFIGNGNQNLNDACPPVKFSVELKNNGYSMISSTNYEVFYIENGNPKNGEKIAEGTIEPIKAGDVATLSYQAEDEGFYAVKAFQHPEYEGEAEKVIWSEKIKVKCPKKEKNIEKEKQSDDVEPLEREDLNEEQTKQPEKKKEESKENTEEQQEQKSSEKAEDETDKSSEQSDSKNEQTNTEQENKQESSSTANKESREEPKVSDNEETDDEPKQSENKQIEKDNPDEPKKQEISPTEKLKEGEQE
ncbi:YqxM protein [Gracilibacillus orientalis]|uniref:YqxM protein n=1 Tax=Gracilibacillus orientalis TaxID=334253 RepID=A0A1I4P737_9BACI|nr:amyloid fiber anchoring/assembly protein TapA [Gracilibacillus orientalis]SFM23357.1 YqxM protein [Gracilibacillus orientalis]